MTKVPTYESQATISPRTMPDAGTSGEMLTKIGQGLEGIGEYFDKLKIQQETLSAKTELDKRIRDIDTDTQIKARTAKTATELDDLSKSANDQISQAINETSGKIRDNEAKNTFLSHAETRAERANTIQNSFIMKQQINLGKDTAINRVDTIMQDYWHSADPGERANLEAEMKQTVADAVNTGYFDRTSGSRYLKTHLNKLHTGQIDHDIELMKTSDNPDTIAKNIRSNIENDSTLNASQKASYQGKVDSGLKYADATNKAKKQLINHQTDKELTWKYINGTLTKDDVLNNYSKMTPERAKSLIKGLDSSTKPTNPHAKEYNEMMNFVGDTKNSERDCINKLLDYETKGKLTAKEAKSLANMFYIPTDKDPVFKVRQMKLQEMMSAQEDKNAMHKTLADQLGSWWKSLPFNKEHKAELMQRLSDAKDKNVVFNTTAQDLTVMAQNETNKFIQEKRPDLATIAAGKIKKDSAGHYGAKTEDGWRDATQEEIANYEQEYGLRPDENSR